MYSQLFGSYLLRKNVITTEQLLHAINSSSQAHIKLGTLAIHNGYMVSAEVDEVCYLQTREDKRFGEIAVERGYLTTEQVKEMLSSQIPDYLLLGQCLVDEGAMTTNDLEHYILDYESESELCEMDLNEESNDKVRHLLERFFMIAEIPISNYSIIYIELLFNNLVRFIGEDFTPMTPIPCEEYPLDHCVTQSLRGKINCTARMDMSQETAVSFASRFVGEEFEVYDEYVQAALEDFMNLHNGLFVVNMSNTESMELDLEPPTTEENDLLTLAPASFMIPINYPFGVLRFLVSIYGD